MQTISDILLANYCTVRRLRTKRVLASVKITSENIVQRDMNRVTNHIRTAEMYVHVVKSILS